MDTTVLRDMVIPQFTEEEWESVGAAFDSLPLSEDEFVAGTKLHRDDACTIMLGAYLLQLVNLEWLVFHDGSNIPCSTRDYLDGFEPAPHDCPYCNKTIFQEQQTYAMQVNKWK